MSRSLGIPSTRSLLTTLGFLLALLVIPATSAGYTVFTDTPSLRIIASNTLKWGTLAGLIGIVVYSERKPIASIGMTDPRSSELFIGIPFIGVILVTTAFISYPVVTSFFGEPATAGQSLLENLSIELRIVTAITAGVTEEVLYRSYPLERIQEWTGSLPFAVIIVNILFVGAHIPAWGLSASLIKLVPSLVFTGIYVYYRSVTAPITTHIYNNLFVLVIVPLL